MTMMSMMMMRKYYSTPAKNFAHAFYTRSISSANLTIEKIKDDSRFNEMMPKDKEDLKGKFGSILSDHMLMVEWDQEKKWSAPKIVPFQNFSMSPASAALHYALECFEGMKAYKSLSSPSSSSSSSPDLLLFRPDKNMERLQRSMDRLQMSCEPKFDKNELIKCIQELVKLDEKWIPYGEGYSLYIRPVAIGTDPVLRVSAPSQVLLYVITSPVGPYYPNGFEPVRLTADVPFVRAWPGGSGDSKLGSNYGPSLKAGAYAVQQGYDQVLWLCDDVITEVGTMNLFFVLQNPDNNGIKELVTPPLTRGDILPGVTRLSILEMAQSWEDVKVSEREVTMNEIQHASKNGYLLEAFGAGTAAVVSPISCIQYKGTDIEIPATGPMTEHIWNELTAIQYGKVKHEWSISF